MTKKELLTACREGVIELAEMERQLSMLGTDGRPSRLRALNTDCILGTNHPAAAAWQLADGLETQLARKQTEVADLAKQAMTCMAQIKDIRTYLIVQRYYLLAETDEQIGKRLALSRVRVTQLRLNYLNAC